MKQEKRSVYVFITEHTLYGNRFYNNITSDAIVGQFVKTDEEAFDQCHRWCKEEEPKFQRKGYQTRLYRYKNGCFLTLEKDTKVYYYSIFYIKGSPSFDFLQLTKEQDFKCKQDVIS